MAIRGLPRSLPPMHKLLLGLLALPLTTAFSAEPALTIYNQNFAVVRDTVPLDLKAGVNDVRFTDTTTHLEPDSVILRDPGGQGDLPDARTELPRRPGLAGAPALALRGQDHRLPRGPSQRHAGDRPGQDRPQRLRAALRRAATLRQRVLPAADGLRQRQHGHGRADHRGGRQAALLAARPAALSRAGGRHDPQADPRLEDPERPRRPSSTPSWPTSPAA